MKSLLLFDVDGTITHSGKKIGQQIIQTLSLLKKRFELGIVGGGKLEKILYQLDGFEFSHYFNFRYL